MLFGLFYVNTLFGAENGEKRQMGRAQDCLIATEGAVNKAK